MKVQLSLHTKTDNIALDVQEVKGAMKQALSSLENFFTGESTVPRYIIMGPARGTTLSKDGLMSFMTKKQTATLHVLVRSVHRREVRSEEVKGHSITHYHRYFILTRRFALRFAPRLASLVTVSTSRSPRAGYETAPRRSGLD